MYNAHVRVFIVLILVYTANAARTQFTTYIQPETVMSITNHEFENTCNAEIVYCSLRGN